MQILDGAFSNVEKKKVITFRCRGSQSWANAEKSGSDVYIQRLQFRDVRNLSQQVKRSTLQFSLCYCDHLPHSLVTHPPLSQRLMFYIMLLCLPLFLFVDFLYMCIFVTC